MWQIIWPERHISSGISQDQRLSMSQCLGMAGTTSSIAAKNEKRSTYATYKSGTSGNIKNDDADTVIHLKNVCDVYWQVKHIGEQRVQDETYFVALLLLMHHQSIYQASVWETWTARDRASPEIMGVQANFASFLFCIF